MNCNIKGNTLFTGDCLHVMYGINSECIDLIYLDPPFNSKRIYRAPIGSKAAGASFKDIWHWTDVDAEHLITMDETHPKLVEFIESIKDSHGKAMMSYITYMAQRIIQMHRILKKTGSIYLHCDPTASHYLKIVMDHIFGKNNFRNEIVWKKYAGRKSNAKIKFPTQHDCVFFYAKSKAAHFRPLYLPMTEKEIGKKYTKVDASGRKYRLAWGRNYQTKREQRKIYLDDQPGRMIGNLWVEDGLQLNTSSKEGTGFKTQKPLALLDRIIRASSNEGDLVLDPFCGCATTCVSANHLHRQWIGIDISDASHLVIDRLSDDIGGVFQDFTHINKALPARTDLPQVKQSEPDMKHELFANQKGICNGCDAEFEIRHFEIDHIIPKSKGGIDNIENRQLLCSNCNRRKGAMPMEHFRARYRRQQEARSKISFGD